MANIVIVGTQWGDEGKGKIVDLLAARADVVVRFQGGNNAGHTMVVNGEQIISHLVPSGILQGKTCLLGNGMVVDPEVLIHELDDLAKRGINVGPDLIKISDRAHLIMPYHKALDQAREQKKGEGKIGTTGRGIGPCYEDRASRNGFRFNDLLHSDLFEKRVYAVMEEKNFILKNYLSAATLDPQMVVDAYLAYADRLKPYISDVSLILDEAFDKEQQVLFEGAQGTHLDIDHGTYPFVTSSHVVAGNACCGAGIGPDKISGIIGIAKAYTTRVGAGPFPTELFDDIGNHIQKKGAEFGATTGRRRRCGWLDMVVLKNAVRLNGLSSLAITKLDILSNLETIKICTGYSHGDDTIHHFPSDLSFLTHCKPVYETLPGWKEDISDIREQGQLPKNARRFLKRVEELAGVPVDMISIGPGRNQTIVVNNPFFNNT